MVMTDNVITLDTYITLHCSGRDTTVYTVTTIDGGGSPHGVGSDVDDHLPQFS